MASRFEFAVETATKCAKIALQHFQQGYGYELKSDSTPVTVADQGIERAIRERLAQEYPGEHVLGEEEGGEDSPDRWVIDPIDGTKSFIAGVPLFATLLSYEVAREPVIGVCVFPALDEVVCAERGGGTLWNGVKCRVTDKSDLSQSIVCYGGLARIIDRGLIEIANRSLTSRGWCDAYGHALVATGRAQAMIDPAVKRWDVSAMSLIVREAGGSWTDLQGNDVITDEALSCVPSLKQELLKRLKP